MGAGTCEEEVNEASRAATWVARPWSETSVESNLAKVLPRSLLPPRARRTATRHKRSRRVRTPSWQGETVARTCASGGAKLGCPRVIQFSATTACCAKVRAARLTRHRSRARPTKVAGGAAIDGAGGHGQGSRGKNPEGFSQVGAQRDERVKADREQRAPDPAWARAAAQWETSMFAPGKRRSKADRSSTNGGGPAAASEADVPGKEGPKWPEEPAANRGAVVPAGSEGGPEPEGTSGTEQDKPGGLPGRPARS